MHGVVAKGSWCLSDALWAKIAPLLPPERPRPRGGRPRMSDRPAMAAILYALRTGCQWKALPRGLGAGSTVHDRFQAWVRAGVFARMWEAGLVEYDRARGIDWTWLAMDGTMTKAPLGGGATGPNPTDRGRCGTKRSIVTDSRGIPVGIAVAGVNRNDFKLLMLTLEAMPVPPPGLHTDRQPHLCLDKGCDYAEVRRQTQTYGCTAHIRGRGEENQAKRENPAYRARRWVVERTHSWMNRFRRLLVRWETKAENYLALLHCACAYHAFRATGIGT